MTHRLASVALGLALIGLVIWAWSDLRAWLSPIAASCRAPTGDEQLHIVIVPRGSIVVGECLYVTSRGAAARDRRR